MAAIFNPSNHHLSHSSQKPKLHFLRKKSPIIISSHLEFPQSPVQLQSQTLDHKFVIVGGSKLSGHVNISGSKNSALAILAGTLCCSGTSKLKNIPNISDIKIMVSILRSLGAKVDIFDDDGEVMVVETDGICSVEPCSNAIGTIRAGFFVVGPLLARFGEAVVALPGGCDIGPRPVDIYIRGLRALGATVELKQNKVHAHAANSRGLVGGRFHLDYPSVGATETLMMAASMADGVTVLSNAAQEPEVVDLARFLTDSGACVEGAGSNTLVITGRNRLHGCEFTVIPDRIEAGTFMVAAAITGSCFSLSPVIPCHLSCLIDKLSDVGCQIRHCTPDTLEIAAKTRGSFQSFNVRTGPFPQFPTDLQPQIMALLTTCNGTSVVEESVFQGRLGHVRELQKFGARIQVLGSTAMVYGKEQGRSLQGSHVVATDLRSGASLILAGLAAAGVTEVEGVSHIDRGYENLETKFHHLGAKIARRPSFMVSQI